MIIIKSTIGAVATVIALAYAAPSAVHGSPKPAAHAASARTSDVNARAKFGQTALMHAARDADLPRAQKLLRAGADVNAADANTFTVLNLAIGCGRVRFVKFLLDHGANVNLSDSNGTPLIHAVKVRDAPTVALLLGRGANVLISDRLERKTPMDWAMDGGDAAIAQLLLAHGAPLPTVRVDQNQWLNFCARQNYFGFAQLLLSRGANVNVRASGGETALIVAAKYGHTAMAALLVSHGARPNLYTSTGMSALTWAQARGHTDIVQLLRRAGAVEGRH